MPELFSDTIKGPADGELFLRPFRPDGSALQNPFAIFRDEESARFIDGVLRKPTDVPEEYIALGANLVVDKGRQVIANLLGGLGQDGVTVNNSWVIGQFSLGTYDTAPTFTDTTLSPQPNAGLSLTGGENTILTLGSGGNGLKLINSVDWPQPFVVRWELIVDPAECNGTLIREAGLWTSGTSPVLFARKTFPAVNKTQDFGLSWLWRVRC